MRCAITELLDPPGAGWVPPLERLIRELRAADARPDDVRAAAEQVCRPELLEAARIYAEVADVPSPDQADWETIRSAPSVALGRVFVIGFDDFPPLEWALLRALATQNDVQVTLAYEPCRHAFDARHERVAGWFAEATVVGHEPGESMGALGRLERSLFERSLPDATDDGVAWAEAAGSDVLYGMVAEAVLDALSEGVKHEEIAVVVPRLADERTAVLGALRTAAVDTRHATRLPFAEAPIGRAMLNLWAFALDDEGPHLVDHFVAWLRSPYSGAGSGQVDMYEADVRRRASAPTRGQMMSRWSGAAISPVRALRGMKDRRLRSQVGYLAEEGGRRLAFAPPAAVGRDDAALKALAGLASQLPSDADPPLVRGDVLPGRLGALLADVSFPERSGPAAGVAVVDMTQIRGLRFRRVIACGLEDGVFPGSPAPDPYLPDPDMRAALALPSRAPGTSESRLRFHAACAAAQDQLVLVRRFADDDGRELAPSPYWNETRRLLGQPLERTSRRRGAKALIPADPTDARTADDRRRAFALRRVPVDTELASALLRRSRARGLTAGMGELTEFRVTELERYLACAYGWFIDRCLAPKPLEQPRDAAWEGSFAHAVLERAYKEAFGTGPCGPDTLDDYRAAVTRALLAVDLEQRPADAGRRHEAFVETLRRRLPLRLEQESLRSPLFAPAEFEISLSSGELVPGVTLTGHSDRVDRSTDGRWIAIVDYKRSGRKLDQKDTVHLQIPIYALMAARQLEAEPAGGAYLPILKGPADGTARHDAAPWASPPRGWLVEPEAWQARIDEAIEHARAAVAGIRGGTLSGPPLSCTAPYCDHDSLWR